MSTEAQGAGKWVRVILEGERRGERIDGFYIGGTYANFIHPASEHVKSVEEIDPPEPEWHEGDVVLDLYGEVFERGSPRDFPWHNFEGDRFADKTLVRPLILLVRDGKPVGGQR